MSSGEFNMKKLIIALSAVAAFSAPALAADMATKAPLRAAPMPYAPSWTGCYVGAGGGYGLWDQENTNVDTATGISNNATNSAAGRGWFGTVQAGCDYQFGVGGSQFVVGAFGDYDFDSLKGSHQTPFINLRGLVGSATADEKMSSAWSVGGRVGWLITPSLLTYFSGGYTEATFDQQNFFGNTPALVPLNFFLDKRTYHGWFLGAGDEYALNFLPGLYWKTEYRLSEFNTERNSYLFLDTGLPTGNSVDSHKWVQTVRSELVYHFNWGGPLVARY
jgi:outer membrane immunogenic protein